MAQLFTPLELGPLTLDNRIIIAPMCMYSAENGVVQPWHHQHVGNLTQSGAGLMIVEASAVAPEGRISYGDAGIWDQQTADAWADVLKNVKRYSNMPVAIQLGHAGRKASCAKPWEGGHNIAPDQENGWQTIAPSALPFSEQDHPPRAMTEQDIAEVTQQFVDAAKRSVEAGFDGLEIHGAHGYLLHQFLSPLSNQRTDQYGGSLENRMRLLLEVFDAIKAAVPQQTMIGVRISATDWVDGGWDGEQSIELAKALEARGCDYIHVSSGGLSEAQQITVAANYQVPFAKAIKDALQQMPVIAVGLITEPEQAEQILQDNEADAIALARGILYDPRWPWHAAAKLGATLAVSPQYLRCAPHGFKDLFTQA